MVTKFTGLQHIQGIQGNSENFQVEENLREVLIFSKKFREVLIYQNYQENFLLELEWDLTNLVQYFVQENWFYLILSAYLEIFKPCGYF